MFIVKQSDFSREFNPVKLLQEKQKEVKKWQWLVLLGCFLLQMLPYCVALNLTSVFVPTDWAVWTNGNQTIMSITFTVGALAAALVGPFIAKIFSKKINMRLVYGIGVILATFGFFGSGINAMIPDEARSLGSVAAVLYLSNIISQIGVMIFSGLGINNLISKWWAPERRGFALGLAFTGGSIGNIWMQQLVKVLTETFGNDQGFGQNGALPDDLGSGERWATYLILAGMGLVSGLLIVLFVCRKPVPPTEIFGADKNQKAVQIKCVGCDQMVDVSKIQANNLEASPLVTRKYPPYWILAVGYLILQMGTVHASVNGQFVQNATVLSSHAVNANYSDIMATGLTLFGVTCFVGNFFGGILNDKIGPNKSIALAGLGQVAAILCLMFSVKNTALVYVYFILAGLSVYVYTSTPSYISGRLYGVKQSNNHMAILGIFIAVGFAIVNSITGALTGDVNASNPHTMFGERTNGNLFALGIFAVVCMAVGTLIVVICSTIIMNKGIKGLLDYTPSKYSRIITFKHSIGIKLAALRIFWCKKDYRNNNKKREEAIGKKLKKSNTYNTCLLYDYSLDVALNGTTRINLQQKQILQQICENKFITLNNLLNNIVKSDEFENNIKDLVKRNLINEIVLGNVGKVYAEGTSLLKKYNNPDVENALTEANEQIFKQLYKIEIKANNKVAKLDHKIADEKAKSINESKQAKIEKRADKQLNIAKAQKTKIFAKTKNYNDWKTYKIEYAYLERIYAIEEMKHQLEEKKQAKIKALQKKIFVANYVMYFNKNQAIRGHDSLINYYNNSCAHCDMLINKNVDHIIDNKVAKIKKATAVQQKKYNKVLALESKLVSERKELN